jgi:hypothetical protein
MYSYDVSGLGSQSYCMASISCLILKIHMFCRWLLTFGYRPLSAVYLVCMEFLRLDPNHVHSSLPETDLHLIDTKFRKFVCIYHRHWTVLFSGTQHCITRRNSIVVQGNISLPSSVRTEVRPHVIFFNLHSGGWSPNWVHSAHRPLTGLLYLPRVIVKMESLVEWMTGETEHSEKTCADATLSTTNLTWPDPGLNPGRRGGKPATNCFSYGAAETTCNPQCHMLQERNRPSYC